MSTSTQTRNEPAGGLKQKPAMSLGKVLYTAKVHTTGGRDGASRRSDGRLDIKLSSPAPRATAPIRSSCSPPVGRPVSSVRCSLRPAK